MSVLNQISALKGQLEYTNEVIASGFNFEAWELKEYKDLKAYYENKITELEAHVEENKEVFYA